MDFGELELQQHYLRGQKITTAAENLLKDAEEQGSVKDRAEAIKVAVMAQEHAGKELLRYRIRKYLLQASNILSGDYEAAGDDVAIDIGPWAGQWGGNTEILAERAREMIERHRQMCE